MFRNRAGLVQLFAILMIPLGLLNAALGNVFSGLVVAVCGVLILLRQRYWPNYPRRNRN